jgi:hypothetical protein
MPFLSARRTLTPLGRAMLGQLPVPPGSEERKSLYRTVACSAFIRTGSSNGGLAEVRCHLLDADESDND